MQPGAHTYWKQPGDAGVPPVFSFNGSQNVAKADVLFPTPTRLNEAGLEAFGYADRVVFPVLVTPTDPGKPAVLKVDVTYAVCRKLCVPAHNAATMSLTPGDKGIDGGKVAAALLAVPIPMTPAEQKHLSIKPIAGAAKPSWTLVWSGAAPVEDIFADAPEGFYFETKRLAANTYSLTATQTVTTAKRTSVPVALTLARKTHSLVATATFDIAGTTN